MISSKRIADSVRLTLRDNFSIGAKAFSDAEIAEYINRALPFVVAMDSSASIVTESMDLAKGVHQKLPERGTRLIKVLTNNIPDYRTRIDGRSFTGMTAPKVLPLTTLNAQNREWASAMERDIATAVVFNKDDPKSFMVYPPNSGAGKLVVSYSKLPEPVPEVLDENPIEIGERYFNAIIYHVMFSCLMRDSEETSNANRAQDFYKLAVGEVAGVSTADATETEAETAKV